MAKAKRLGCGKLLRGGMWVSEHQGVVLCSECDDRLEGLHIGAHLRDGITIRCGQRAEQAKEAKNGR